MPPLLTTPAENMREHPGLLRECFGPAPFVITHASAGDQLNTLRTLPGPYLARAGTLSTSRTRW